MSIKSDPLIVALQKTREELGERLDHQGASVEATQRKMKSTRSAIKKLDDAIEDLSNPLASKPHKPSKSNNGPSKQQVKDQVLTTALACLEKQGDLSDAKLREAIKESLPEIDLTGRLRRFSDWLQDDGRMTEVSPGVWTLRTLAAHVASESQQAETPGERQLPPR